MTSLLSRLLGRGDAAAAQQQQQPQAGSPGDAPTKRTASITSFTSSVSANTEKRPASLPSIATSLGIPDLSEYHPSWLRRFLGTAEDAPPISASGATNRAFFEDVIRGRRPAPWRPEFFMDHCESELNAEALHYYYEIEGMKRLAGDAGPTSPGAVTISDDDLDGLVLVPKHARPTPRAWAERVVATYVVNDAPEQVNISSAQREATIKRLEAFDELGPRGVFDESQAECVKLMHQDVFPRFAKSMLTTNVNERSRSVWFVKTIVYALLTLGAQAACLAVFAPRPVFAVFLLPWLLAANGYYAYTRRFCMMSCMRDVKYVRDGSGSSYTTERIACPITRGYLHAKAKVVAVKLLLIAGFMTALPVIISYIVEAGLGRSLY